MALKEALFNLLLLFWGHPQRVLPVDLLQKVLASAGSTLAMEAIRAVSALRSRLSFLGFDDCIITLRGRGYQFIPPDAFQHHGRTVVRTVGNHLPLAGVSCSARRFGVASF